VAQSPTGIHTLGVESGGSGIEAILMIEVRSENPPMEVHHTVRNSTALPLTTTNPVSSSIAL
jgi:hypothetical protein